MQESLISLFFVWLGISIIMSLAGGILYAIYLPIKKWLLRTRRLTPHHSKLINRIYIIGIFFFTAYHTYYAVFPGLDFYEGEYTYVTMRDLPTSAEFVSVNSSYPDFHGDYCSSSQIKLSKSDYQKLLKELQSDRHLIKNIKNVGFSEFDYTLKGKFENKIIIAFQRQIVGEEDRYLSIHFYDDQQTIFVNVCVT